MSAARMPEPFRSPLGKKISEIAVGEEALITIMDICVADDYETYLKPDGTTVDRRGGLLTARVKREPKGMVLYLRSKTQQAGLFKPYPIEDSRKRKLIPVVEIVTEIPSGDSPPS